MFYNLYLYSVTFLLHLLRIHFLFFSLLLIITFTQTNVSLSLKNSLIGILIPIHWRLQYRACSRPAACYIQNWSYIYPYGCRSTVMTVWIMGPTRIWYSKAPQTILVLLTATLSRIILCLHRMNTLLKHLRNRSYPVCKFWH